MGRPNLLFAIMEPMNKEQSLALQNFTQHIRELGAFASQNFGSNTASSTQKEDDTVVTDTDLVIETKIRAHIEEHFPGDITVGEEYGAGDGERNFVWFIDPIDGTYNFVKGIPFCAISCARLGEADRDSFGLVYNPITGQTFSSLGEEGAGVYENDRSVLPRGEMKGGKYEFTIGRSTKEVWMKPAAYALHKALGMKYGRSGAYNCSSLEIAYVATGKIDGYLSYGLQSYDYAAGMLLARLSGASISIFENGEWHLWEDSIADLCKKKDAILFTSHLAIHEEVLSFIGNPKDWATE